MEITLTQDAYLAGGTYRLPTEDGTSSAYVLDGAWYEARATDSQGNRYMVYWEIREDFDPNADDDEMDACDWDKPCAVVCDDCDVTRHITKIHFI